MNQSNPLKLVKLKRSLLQVTSYHSILNEILEHLKQMSIGSELRKDPEFILYVCRLVECVDIPKNIPKKVDKKQLVKDIFCLLFPELNNDIDLNHLDILIEFLHSNKKIVGVSLASRVTNAVCDFVARKIL